MKTVGMFFYRLAIAACMAGGVYYAREISEHMRRGVAIQSIDVKVENADDFRNYGPLEVTVVR